MTRLARSALLLGLAACEPGRVASEAAPQALGGAPTAAAPAEAAAQARAPAALEASAPAAGALEPGAAPLPASGEPLRFLVIGGGPTPESNEVSLEQDVELVRRALPGPGHVLFAGGGASPSVRVLDPELGGDALRLALGELFAPRNGRQSRYRLPRFAAERATLANVEARLSQALSRGQAPLFVYIAAHGEQGSEAKGNAVALWGGHALSVTRLAELHEGQARPLRLVATSCFSGGFAELAFARADARSARPSPVARCGVFAGTADRETSGCDPDPDRRAQESYGLHLGHALGGTRKDGTPLSAADADYDRDGTIGLLDAHTWARITAVSLDVPTTTSERWLRRFEPGSGPLDRAALPEDAAVIERLGAALGLRHERAVQERWAALDRELRALDRDIDAAEDAVAERSTELATHLLERWPVLDDPFHPEFERVLARERSAIERALGASAAAQARAEANASARALYARLDALAVEEARVSRLVRAYETLHKASLLMKKKSAAARHYRELLACERGTPTSGLRAHE